MTNNGGRVRRYAKIIYNIILYSLAAIGLAFVLFAIFSPKTPDGKIALEQPKKIILVPTKIPTSTPPPTATNAPTRTPRPTATDAPDYMTSLITAIKDLSPSMIAVTNMLDRPQYGNQQWTDSMHKELDLIDATYSRVLVLVPPASRKDAHAVFLSAVGRCRDSAGHFRLAVDNNDPSEASMGLALLNSCTEQVRLAGDLFKR